MILCNLKEIFKYIVYDLNVRKEYFECFHPTNYLGT